MSVRGAGKVQMHDVYILLLDARTAPLGRRQQGSAIQLLSTPYVHFWGCLPLHLGRFNIILDRKNGSHVILN